MSGTVGNIIARVGADVSPLTEDMKKAQSTILTFKDESLAALKSFGLPHISSTNLVESIQSGQRVVVNFAKESGESLTQFQQRVRTTFTEAGIDITAYERALTDADRVHAEFAKGAVKSFQAVSAAAEEVNNKAQELRSSLGTSLGGIKSNFSAFKDSVGNAFKTLGDGSASFGEKIGSVSNAVVDGFGLMTGALEIFIAVEIVKKVGEWINVLKELAAETEDAEHRFYASMGQMSDEAEQFSKKLSDSYGVDQEALKNMMGKEYMNTRMLGFDPTQAEGMSEHITQLSYDLGKLRGIDPSQAFDAIQRGIEGQTRGLMDLGIRITTTDLKNRALSEGLIKQGQVMTDAQTSLMAYQMIMEKTAGVQGYYKTTTDDLSSQQAKLNAGWEEMKRKLADSLTPAFTGFMKVLNVVAGGLELLVEDIATSIQSISLFAEDTYSAITDILSLNFGQINADWQNNDKSIFAANDAAKQYGNSLDTAIGAANDATGATKAQNAAQKALGKTLNANTMSFDQLHNITNSGAAAAQAQTDAIGNLANALGNLKNPGMGDITDNKSRGIVIPITFGPIPPIPPIPPPPPVLENWATAASLALAAWVTATEATLGGWETATELGVATWAMVTKLGLGAWAVASEAIFTAWAGATELILAPWAAATELIFAGWVAANKILESGWARDFEAGFSEALNTTEKMADGWATRVGRTLSNVGENLGNWASNHQDLLGAIGTGIAVGGVTLATGGLDLIPAGIAAAGSALAGIGASLVPNFGMATGGIVNSPQIHMIGEAGPEAVIPLDKLGGMMNRGGHPSPSGSSSGGSTSQPINVTLQLDGRTLARTTYSYNVNEKDRIGKHIGYDSSYNYPK
ncbi:MAG: lysozyme family protein [Desulfitobacteriaceae bacterium]